MQKSSTYLNQSGAGFTLIETVVVISIVAVVSVLSFALVSLDEDTKFEGQAQNLLAVMRQMQSNARTVQSNLEYGVSFTGNTWTTFSVDPATGTQTNIETRQLQNETVTTSFMPSASQVVFTRLTGAPKNSTSGTITMANAKRPNRSIIIKVEATGVVYVQ